MRMIFKKYFNINIGRKLFGIEMFDNFEFVYLIILISIFVFV